MRVRGWSILAALLVLLSLTFAAVAFQKPVRAPLPNFDKRGKPHPESMAEKRRAGERLKSLAPDGRVDFDEVLGTVKMVGAKDGFLTGPKGESRAVPSKSAGAFAVHDRHRGVKAFLEEHHELFGHGAEALEKAKLKREYVTAHSGMQTVVWEQEYEGIPVFEAVLVGHTTRDGELIQISSRMVPNAVPAKGGKKSLTQLAVSPKRAVVLVASNLGEELAEAELTTLPEPGGIAQKHRVLSKKLKGDGGVNLVWLPLNAKEMRLCWEVILGSASRGETYRVLVDADTGECLVRHCLTKYANEATYRVFTGDSPTPLSPAYSEPVTNQPPLVERSLVTLSALKTNASPNGWINEGSNQTIGNNVDAHLDRNRDDLSDTPQVEGVGRVFDFPMDLVTQDPTNYGPASVVQLFYWCNWMHDRLYELGFTEAAGNFQATNFARGGLQGDPVQADAQDGGGTDNANMTTLPDGASPRMQMYIWSHPRPRRDGDLDAEIILHEYTHGLSERLVGGGVGLTTSQAGGLAEGWSDFYALALLSEPGDDPNGNYACGAYSSYLITAGFRQNYYYGIRRYPYSTDLEKNPVTFKDIDPGQATGHPGVPISPGFAPYYASSAGEVHNQGEVWCSALWEARANLIARHGHAIGNELTLRLVTDGMKLCPPNPNFLQARDAILQADRVSTAGSNFKELWSGFAKRGLGYSAVSPASSTTVGVQEAFDFPDDLQVSPGTYIARGPVGGPFTPMSGVFILTNMGTNRLSWSLINTCAWLNVLPERGSLEAGEGMEISAALITGILELPSGIHSATVQLSNEVSGVLQSVTFLVYAGLPDYFTQWFDSETNGLAYQSFTFTPDGSASYYRFCRESIAEFPTDPGGGNTLSLTDDSFRRVTLAGSDTIALYGQRTKAFHIGSNGYLTFEAGDLEWSESFENHFKIQRVSALFEDLNPEIGGTISWQELSNRVVVTYLDVPQWGATNQGNSFQIEMFHDGAIRLSYLGLNVPHGLVGLSRGSGIPADFDESHYDRYAPCGPSLFLTLAVRATEGAGVLAGAGEVRVPAPLLNDLTVFLFSSDTTEVTVPGTVTLLAGTTNALFDLNIVDDADLDGTQWAQINAVGPVTNQAEAQLGVDDNEATVLQVILPAEVTEGAGEVLGNIVVSAPPTADVTVYLSSSDASELQVPEEVVIPAGQTSAVFQVSVVDDGEIDGPSIATVTAEVRNWTKGSAEVLVLDNESLELTLALPFSASESDGTLAEAGEVRLSGTLATNLEVALVSSDPTQLVVPSSLTISAGQLFSPFKFTLLDDLVVDSNQTFTITGSAPGFLPGAATIIVIDDEIPPIPSEPSPSHLAENVPANTRLRWSGATDGTSNEVYFGLNPTPGPGEYLGCTNGNSWPLPTLAPATTYYWQVISRRAGVATGPVWQFTTRGIDHFDWETVASPQLANQPFSVKVTARDEWGQIVTNFTNMIQLSGHRGMPGGVEIGSVQISPSGSDQFTNGCWSGEMVVLEPVTNMFLKASDGSGHEGLGNSFAVLAMNDLALSVQATPDPVETGTIVSYSLVLSNSGPSAASAVWITNVLAEGVTFVSAESSQGDCTNVGNLVLCDLGAIAGASNANVIIRAFPTVPGLLTNYATFGRGEPDGDQMNNTVMTESVATWPSLSISDVVIREGDRGHVQAVFGLRLAQPNAQPISVSFALSNGTALAGIDYVPTNGVLSFAPGETNREISVEVIGDTMIESDEDFYLCLTDLTNVISSGVARALIINDDGVAGEIDHFVWEPIPSPQQAGLAFSVKIYALDYFDALVTNYSGSAHLAAEDLEVGVLLLEAAAFTNGIWTGDLAVSVPATNLVLMVKEASGHSGASNPFHVTSLYQPPIVLQEPASQTVVPGGFVSFSVSVFGAGPLYYQWLHDMEPISGGTAAMLAITNLQTAHAGIYSVIVSNVAGVVFCDAYLTVVVPPTDTSVGVGSTATLEAVVSSGFTNEIGFQWQFNGIDIAGANSTNLVLTNVHCGQAGIYTFVLTKPVQTASVFHARLSVTNSSAPLLRVMRQDTNVVISWNSPCTPYVLEETVLFDDPSWTAVDVPLRESVGETSVVLTVDMESRFYRLRAVTNTAK